MAGKTRTEHAAEFHKQYLEDAPPGTPLLQAIVGRNVTSIAQINLVLDYMASHVTVGELRAWLVRDGASLPGVLGADPKKSRKSTSHGARTKDGFIIVLLSGRPFMPGLFSTYKDALDASATADMPTKIDRYSIPETTDGDYCEKCVELVVKASMNRNSELASYHED